MDRAEIRRTAAAQAGLITRWQAELAGCSASAIARRVGDGSWLRVRPGVFAVAGVEPDAAGRVVAAALWAGPGTVVWGPAALWWWGLRDAAPVRPAVAVPLRRNLRGDADVRVIRRPVAAEDQTTHRGIRVVTRDHAVLFGSAELGPAGQQVLDRALLTWARPEQLRTVLERNRCARGAALVRRWLDAAGDGSAAESERLYARLLRGAGISGWTVNRRDATGFTPDFTFRAARLLVEIDGWAFHTSPAAFQRDRARQNALVLAGWTVLRFTWRQLTTEPDHVLAQTVAILNRNDR